MQYTVFDQLKLRLLKRQNESNELGSKGSSEALSAFTAFVLGAVSKSVATVLTYPAIRYSIFQSLFDLVQLLYFKQCLFLINCNVLLCLVFCKI